MLARPLNALRASQGLADSWRAAVCSMDGRPVERNYNKLLKYG